MKRIFLLCIVPVFAACAVDLGLSSAVQFSDARFGCDVRAIDYMAGQPGMFEVQIPNGDWNALTFTMCGRLTSTASVDNIGTMLVSTASLICPEPIRRSAPDLLGGRCGFPDGTNLTAAVSFDLAFSHEGGSTPSNFFPRGVYTVSGWSSNVVTVILGGDELTFGPGDFNRNMLPGPSDGVVVDGTGLCAVAVSRLHAHQFFSFLDGVVTEKDGKPVITGASSVTNELVFLCYRFAFTPAGIVKRCDLWHVDSCDSVGVVETNALPNDPAVRAFSSQGLYRIGFGGLCPSANLRFDVFDYRCFARWLYEEDMLRVFDNGRLEIERRGIPRWRNGY